MAPKPARVLAEEVMHSAVPTGGDKVKCSASDQLYSKLICCACGIGEVLGDVVCGEFGECLCVRCDGAVGLGGEGGCPAGGGTCEMFKPKVACGIYEKCLCLKVGFVNPL